MFREAARVRAAQDMAEVLGGLSGGDPMPAAPPQPLPAPLRPQGPPGMPPGPGGRPQGALQMGQLPASMQRPSPLQTMHDFKSPPVAAALQGAVGREGPVGFSDGGFVVIRS